MEKKNTILLTVIAVATLLVAIVGATFAYFATDSTISANIPVNVNTAGNAAIFTSSVGTQEGDGSINITVDANEMQKADADPAGGNVSNVTGLVGGLTDTATLKVQLKTPVEGQKALCTYDVIFTWSGEENTYSDSGTPDDTTDDAKAYYQRTTYMPEGENPTAALIAKEFTIQAVGTRVPETGHDNDQTTYAGVGTDYADDMAPTVSEGAETPKIDATVEHNFDEYKAQPKTVTVPATTEGGEPTTKTVKYIELLKGLKIETTDATVGTTVNWVFTAKFYNSTRDQSIQMNKKFLGNISVNPDTIVC